MTTQHARDEEQDDAEYLQAQADRFRDGYMAAIKKMHSSGQMTGMVTANELLLLLPEAFVQAYERLFWTALSDPSAVNTREGIDKAKGNSGTVLGSDTRLQAAGTGKRYRNTGFLIGSEKALARKQWVDQKLDDLVSDINASLKGESLRTRQCPGHRCRRMLDRKWNWCPNCGTPTGRKPR